MRPDWSRRNKSPKAVSRKGAKSGDTSQRQSESSESNDSPSVLMVRSDGTVMRVLWANVCDHLAATRDLPFEKCLISRLRCIALLFAAFPLISPCSMSTCHLGPARRSQCRQCTPRQTLLGKRCDGSYSEAARIAVLRARILPASIRYWRMSSMRKM